MRRINKPKSKSRQKRRAAPVNFKRRPKLKRTTHVRRETDVKLQQAHYYSDQQITQLHALHRIGTSINSTFDLEEILGAICDSMAKDLRFEKSGIVFLEKTGQKPLQSAYVGFTSKEYRALLDHFDDLVSPALQNETVHIETLTTASLAWQSLLKTISVSSMLLLPMRITSRLTGFIVGANAQPDFKLSDPERQFYSMYAAQASISIENARLYEALGQANLTLEEKVAERTRNLVEANERLRDLDQVKSNFISLVSHELRTPLTAIKGFIVTLFHYDKEIPEEKRHVYLSVLNEETDRLTRLITELLDISRIESGRIEIQWHNAMVPDIVQRVFDTLSMKAGTVKMIKEFPEHFPEIIADPDKLEQVFVNLVDNSLKYSQPNAKVTVRGEIHHDSVVISVRDEGPGIPFSEQEKVFDKFFRSDNEVNRKNPGTGLGLPICRALINLHGGKVWVQSEPGEGCQFILMLPLNRDKKTSPALPQVTGDLGTVIP